MGMFSLLDALIDQPLEEALRSVDLGPEVTSALLEKGRNEDLLPSLYRLVCAYEQGKWDEVEGLSRPWRISNAAIGQAYIDSVAWSMNWLLPPSDSALLTKSRHTEERWRGTARPGANASRRDRENVPRRPAS